MATFSRILNNPLFQRAQQQSIAKAQGMGLALPQMATKGIMGQFAAQDMANRINSQRFATQRAQDAHKIQMAESAMGLARARLGLDQRKFKFGHKMQRKQHDAAESELFWSIPMGLGTLGLEWYKGNKQAERKAIEQAKEDKLYEAQLAYYKKQGVI